MIETFFKIKTVVTLEFFFETLPKQPIRIMHGGALSDQFLTNHTYSLCVMLQLWLWEEYELRAKYIT